MQKECPECHGIGFTIVRGKIERWERIKCPKCKGKGFLDESPFKKEVNK